MESKLISFPDRRGSPFLEGKVLIDIVEWILVKLYLSTVLLIQYSHPAGLV